MKKKLSKILGIGLAFVLLVSLMIFAIPVSAGPYGPLMPLPNMWVGYYPTPSGPTGPLADEWFFDPAITKVGPIAQATDVDGDGVATIYAYVADATGANVNADEIFMSIDDGRTWYTSGTPGQYSNLDTDTTTPAVIDPPGPVVDMVCSSLYEDVIYLTDGNYVYKSVDAGMNWGFVAQDDLEKNLMGDCGIPITGLPITCIDVGYDTANKPIVFIGTRHIAGRVYASPHPWAGDFVVGSVYWIADETFPASWTDLELKCYGCCDPEDDVPADIDSFAEGCFDVYSVGVSPTFTNSNKVYVLVSKPITLIFNDLSDGAIQFTVTGDATNGATFTWSPDPLPANLASTCGVNPVTLAPGATCTFTCDGLGAATDAARVDLTVTAGSATVTLDAGDGTLCENNTEVIYTVGTICSWVPVSNLRWDCVNDDTHRFEISHGSRFAFPSYYSTSGTMFIGVAGVAAAGPGGDVYRVEDTPSPLDNTAIDLNVQGPPGCTGMYHANICSLDIDNDYLAAGAWDSFELQSPVRVYYSSDGGWAWASSLKDPTGAGVTYVLFGNSLFAATEGCDCAFSLSCETPEGAFFNQISLINMDIDQVLDLTHAPGYITDASTMYVLTEEVEACDLENIHSLLRWDNTYWERVNSSRYYFVTAAGVLTMYTPQYDWVEASPDFGETRCLYMANTGFDMARSLDAGCSWAPILRPCEDKPDISAWIVVDLETVLAGGAGANAGTMYKTTSHGSQPWKEYLVPTVGLAAGNGVDFDLSPNIANDNSVLYSDLDGNVYMSEDLGETWTEVMDGLFSASFYTPIEHVNTYVVFDPGYGTADDPGENMIYAAAGELIGRCDINHDALLTAQDWVYMFDEVCVASGIDAAGDTALYVSDGGEEAVEEGDVTVTGTIEIDCEVLPATDDDCDNCSRDVDLGAGVVVTTTYGSFINEELVEIVTYNLTCELACCDDPVDDCCCTIAGQIGIRGLESNAQGHITISDTIVVNDAACDCGVGPIPCAGTANATVVSSFLQAAAPGGTAACPTGVWRSLNPMDVVTGPFVTPAINLVVFEKLILGPPSSLWHPQADAFGVFPDDLWLTKGSNVLWCLDSYTPYDAYIWEWDDPLAAQVTAVSPADGTALITTDEATVSWNALDAAIYYDLYIFSYCPSCPDLMFLEQMISVEAALYCIDGVCCYVVTDLTPGTTYYWKVRVKSGQPYLSKWSDMWSFDTALSTTIQCSPLCGEEDISLTPNFSWSAVVGATGYEIEVSLAEDFATLIASGAPTINAWDGIPELEYGTTYYWRVRAINAEGVPSAWTYCLFSTMEEPEEPTPPITPVTIVTEEITPTWIWVIIGVGAALVIVVIVLIVTTRRVS